MESSSTVAPLPFTLQEGYPSDQYRKEITIPEGPISLKRKKDIHDYSERPNSPDTTLCTRQTPATPNSTAQQKDESFSKKPTCDNRYSCEICDKSFVSFSKIQRHQAVHTLKKDFRCLFCYKLFTQQASCNYHKKTSCPKSKKPYHKKNSCHKSEIAKIPKK